MNDTEAPPYRALAMLEHEYAPTVHRRTPYWRPRPPACWRDVHLPAWNWVHPDYDTSLQMDMTVVDAIGAFVAAASSATFAHGELVHRGALADYDKRPGYYRIDAHGWSDPRIPSPLGSADLPAKVWVAHPTMELLTQLSEAGYWPAIHIHDAWTADVSCRMREWATRIRNDRAEALRLVAAARACGAEREVEMAEATYEAIKTGYSMAVQLMRGPAEGGKVKSAVRRPDWHDTIHAQHAASTWRKVWKCVVAGYVPVMMGSVDEVVWDTVDLRSLVDAGLFPVDESGIQLGAFKVKERIMPETADA